MIAPPRGAARERIIAEAREQFLTRGFADVSMQQIADASGITKAALYYHFRNKEDLFAEIIRRAVNEFWGGLIACTEQDGSLRDILLEITAFAETMATDRVPWLILNDVERYLSAEVRNAIFTEHPEPDVALAGLLERSIAAGEIRPINVQLAARLLTAMLLGLFHNHHEHVQPQSGDAEQMVDLFLNGVLPRE